MHYEPQRDNVQWCHGRRCDSWRRRRKCNACPSQEGLRRHGINNILGRAFTSKRTWLRVTARETDKFRANASLQALKRDLVLLQEPRRIVVGVPCHLLLGCFDDFTGPRADLIKGSPREADDARGEETRSLGPSIQSD